MKTIIIFFLSVILLFSIAIGWEVRNIRKKDQTIIQLETKIDSLSHSFERYGISVGDTTLQVITRLKIQGKPYKYLHIERIKKGKNEFYFVLRENVAVELIIMKY